MQLGAAAVKDKFTKGYIRVEASVIKSKSGKHIENFIY